MEREKIAEVIRSGKAVLGMANLAPPGSKQFW